MKELNVTLTIEHLYSDKTAFILIFVFAESSLLTLTGIPEGLYYLIKQVLDCMNLRLLCLNVDTNVKTFHNHSSDCVLMMLFSVSWLPLLLSKKVSRSQKWDTGDWMSTRVQA